MKNRKVLLCILDGWGVGKKNQFNAIHKSKKENFLKLEKKFGFSRLFASENQVGLPSGQFGNSEVGHMNIGAGRILLQDILRISEGFKSGEIEENNLIKSIVENCSRIHLVGILSDGGVHGHQDHLFKLLKIFRKKNVEILVHCILDGRDSLPISGLKNMQLLLQKIKESKNIKIASICGRYYAMDRDNRWNRIHLAYKAIVEGSLKARLDPIAEIKKSYDNQITDEFFKPINFENYSGVLDGDGFFITNFRADRVRELLASIFEQKFLFFKRKRIANFFKAISMVEYSKRLRKSLTPIFESLKVKNTIGEVISNQKLKQLRIAETEKYAHVTYFFNGGLEEKFPGEDRILISSPRVDTYDKKPEMSANEMTEELLKRLRLKKYDFVVANFANADMVGHTGDINATVKAVETVDICLGRIVEECKRNNYTLIVTSDHGNADKMFDEKKSLPCTTHTTNPVPFIICNKKIVVLKTGCLANIAPTILKLMKIKKPKEMKSKSLIE